MRYRGSIRRTKPGKENLEKRRSKAHDKFMRKPKKGFGPPVRLTGRMYEIIHRRLEGAEKRPEMRLPRRTSLRPSRQRLPRLD